MEKQLKKFLKNGKFYNVSSQRSKTMSAIKGKNNRSTELCLRMALIRAEVRGWKLNQKTLPGTPDFYFPYEKLAVFVNGCYWHGCPKCGHIPKTRSKFWAAKINRTKQRDREKRYELKNLGVTSIVIWEHDLKSNFSVSKAVNKIVRKIKNRKKELYGSGSKR